MRVTVSAEAEAGLQDIARFIARNNPRRAASYIRELRAAALKIGNTPKAFPLLPRFEQQGLRSRSYGNYRIFYRINDDHVQILKILHAARDHESLLAPDP